MKSLRLLLFVFAAIGILSSVACHKKHERCAAYDQVISNR